MKPTIPPYARHLLTRRELEIVERLPAPPAEIARDLFITNHNVRVHLRHIRHKLGIPTKVMLDELAPLILAAAQPVNLDIVLSCPHCGQPLRLTVNRVVRSSRSKKAPPAEEES